MFVFLTDPLLCVTGGEFWIMCVRKGFRTDLQSYLLKPNNVTFDNNRTEIILKNSLIWLLRLNC